MIDVSRRDFLRLTGGLAAAAGLAACSSNADATNPKKTHALDASHPFGGDPAAEGTPVRGGRLAIGMDREATVFDPTVMGANEAASAIYDSLLRFDAKGDPQPYLAKSMTTPDAGTTWILGLRPGVVFHDGTPLNADAVIFNIQRHRDTPTSPCYQYTLPIRTMTAVDDLTVKFSLADPVGSFASNFALPWAIGNLGAIASPTAVRQFGADYGRHPVGAGPFRFVQWIPDSHITMDRFDRYWQQGMPRLDGLEFRPLSDTESRYASVVNGDVDLIYAGYQTEIYRSSANKNLVTYYGPGSGAEYLYFNFTRPPFNDRRMREALIRSVDPKALSATQFSGAMSPAVTCFPATDPDYSAAAAKNWPTFDPGKARSLIASYRSSGGEPDFTLDAPNSPNRVLFATFVQAQWAAVGLKVKLNFSDLAKFSSTVVQSGDFQCTTWVGGPWDSPYPYVYNLFHSKGNANYGKYTNPEMDRVVEQAISTSDPATRTRAYQQAQVIANNDLIVDWYSRGYLGTITTKKVRGVVRYLSREAFWATTWLAK